MDLKSILRKLFVFYYQHLKQNHDTLQKKHVKVRVDFNHPVLEEFAASTNVELRLGFPKPQGLPLLGLICSPNISNAQNQGLELEPEPEHSTQKESGNLREINKFLPFFLGSVRSFCRVYDKYVYIYITTISNSNSQDAPPHLRAAA